MDETTLRLVIFFGLFAGLALAEVVVPRRPQKGWRSGRWMTNWALSILNAAMGGVLKTVLGLAAVVAAFDAAGLGVGLFNGLDWPFWAEVGLTFLILDFLIWLQHLLFHKVPVFWRIHRVHHADPHIDVTTAIRFHPIEIALSLGIKIGAVYALGAPVLGVVIFEIVLNAGAMFTHANIRLPLDVDRKLRHVFVTPDMHRIHHSVDRAEHDTNYGFNLAIWDRLFGTYTAEPRFGHTGMDIGLVEHQSEAPKHLVWSLLFPFRR